MNDTKALTLDEHYQMLKDAQPVEIGKQWEIDVETYYEFLNVLPPLNYRIPNTAASFAMCEFWTGTITSAYFKTKSGRYFHRWIDYSQTAPPYIPEEQPARPFVGYVKRAWIRNKDMPAGRAAPGRINCPCQNAPETHYSPETGDIVCNCGAVYTWDGWIVKPSPHEEKTP